ncbi:DNA/RNA polymerase [Artomyces pyxidatus]|uniref:DNA/RNA polymerase n=1 Tax=Artomyces pyxidatus TaxID=48021 RepID=A0ACB8TG25_9AGAM|nr:DNA/RNA polymerase [Artomyces pyxidatus]
MSVNSSLKPHSRDKSRASPPDNFEDLNPRITYRHLLSQSSGPRDPLRVVALCDSDAFYAACEQRRLNIDPSQPLVVRQWDALIAVNYPARKFGISRMSKWRDALKKCPELVIVHVATYKEGEREPGYWDNPDTSTHKISLDYYRRESAKILSIFKEGLPEGEIEKASIDEAFIDFSGLVRKEILQRYPYLAQVPPDAPHGLDTVLPPPPPISWENLGIIIPIHPNPESTGGVVGEGADQSEEVLTVVDGKDVHTTWHDVALSIAAERMNKIRADVRTQLGYTTSAGISRNKFLAKLTASYKKFDSQSVLRNAAIPNYLRPLPFQKIRFLGGKLGQALAAEYDVSTVGDLLTISLDEMQRKFGENAIWIYELLRGIDRSEVKEKPALTKSMMASKNLPQPITTVSEGPHWLRVLAAELGLRLNDARTDSPSVWPKSIVLHVRHGYEPPRSRQTPFPFVRNVTVDVIAGFADKLWKELVGGGKDGSTPIKITNIALTFTGLEAVEVGQQSIEGFFQSGQAGPSKPPSKPPSHSSMKRKNNASPERRHKSLWPPDSDSTLMPGSPSAPTSGNDLTESHRYVCPRCHVRLDFPDDDVGTMDPNEREAALARMRLEHDDFHFAQDLAQGGDGSGGLRLASVRPHKRKKTETTKEGIAKFFTRE